MSSAEIETTNRTAKEFDQFLADEKEKALRILPLLKKTLHVRGLWEKKMIDVQTYRERIKQEVADWRKQYGKSEKKAASKKSPKQK